MEASNFSSIFSLYSKMIYADLFLYNQFHENQELMTCKTINTNTIKSTELYAKIVVIIKLL